MEDSKYPPNDFIERVLSRATVRRYKQQPLAEGQLELLIAAAQSAASSGMLQTWSVIALTDKEHKDLLVATPEAKISMGSVDSSNMTALKECAVFLIWLADLSRVDNILKAHVGQYNLDLDILAQTSRAEYQLKAVIDAAIAAQTFSLAAESQGLAVMYCGAVRQISIDHLRKSFNLPHLTFPIFGMAIGYPMMESFKPIKPRLPTNLVLHHNQYTPLTDMSKLDQYNRIHKEQFTGSIKLINKNYVERIIERMAVTEDKKAVGPRLRQMGFDFN